eukprot:GSChrysophyteH1.ASY1.ANO1.599.1 assembled CDS
MTSENRRFFSDNYIFGTGDESDSDSISDESSEEVSSDEYEPNAMYQSSQRFDSSPTVANHSMEEAIDDYIPSLNEVVEDASDIAKQIANLEMIIQNNPTVKGLNGVKDQVASIFGFLEDLQYEIDSLVIKDETHKLLRRHVIEEVNEMFSKIANISDECVEILRLKADEERVEGNSCFKNQKFSEAIKHYSKAITINPENATLFTNRALAYEKSGQFDRGIQDAKVAVRMDANYLKAYIILIRCQLALSMLVSASETIGDIPLAFQDRLEVTDLAQSIAAGAKTSGNEYFKAGSFDEAIAMYTVAVSCRPDEHIYYSNRSAAYQSRKSWREALADAERCLKLCNTFAKAYVHIGRCQIQLRRYEDAERTVAMARTLLEGTSELSAIAPQLAEISKQAHFTKQQQATKAATGPDPVVKAEQLKDIGNRFYKQEEYQEAAAWLMMREYRRAISDCKDGLRYEEQVGSLDKLRLRHATSLAAMGQVENGVSILEEAIEMDNRQVNDNVGALTTMLEKLNAAKQHQQLGLDALENKSFSRARRLFESAQRGGLTDAPKILLGLSRASLGLHEYEDASRSAQKAIEADGGLIEAYVLRSDALLSMGCTDLAEKHLKVALQRDPDNGMVQVKLKTLRRVVAELTRVRGLIDSAMNEHKLDDALAACNEGLMIDNDSKKIMSEMHGRKSKAHSMLALQHQRRIHAPSADDTNSSLYYDATKANIPTLFLKCAALQALEKWEEAHSELEACFHGIGKDDSNVAAKLKEAKMLLKKSQRPDLYKILGVTQGERATEAEIKKAYKKGALKWHPDRHSSKGEVQRKEAETKFKEISDAFELLTDARRKGLYDQGYDREEIEQKIEEEKQRREYASQGYGRRGGGGGGGGFYGF